AVARNCAVSKAGILATLIYPKPFYRPQDAALFSSQNSPLFIFRKEASPNQRNLRDLPSQDPEFGRDAVALGLVRGKGEEVGTNESGPRNRPGGVRKVHRVRLTKQWPLSSDGCQFSEEILDRTTGVALLVKL